MARRVSGPPDHAEHACLRTRLFGKAIRTGPRFNGPLEWWLASETRAIGVPMTVHARSFALDPGASVPWNSGSLVDWCDRCPVHGSFACLSTDVIRPVVSF